MSEKVVGILSTRGWQQGGDDERQRKEMDPALLGSDATLFSPLHDLFIYL